jgi:hypothetical protein
VGDDVRRTTARSEGDERSYREAARPPRKAASLRLLREAPVGDAARDEALLAPGVDGPDRVAIVCDGVIDIAAALFNVSGRELRGPGRASLAVSRVRQIAMYVTHVTLRLSMRDVGQGFGRDRTTVLYACHQIEDLREDEEFDDIVARVEQVVTAAFGMCLNRD